MDKLPAITGALIGGLFALACVAYITGAATGAELISGAVALAATIVALILLAKD
jgi:hypothetical protein